MRLRPVGALSVFALTLVGSVPSSYANSTLRVTGDICNVDPDFKPVPKVSRLIGRVTVLDDRGVLHFEPNVPLIRSGGSPDNCLVDFDVHFTPELLNALLNQEMFIKVEACGVPKGRNFEAATGSVCSPDDPAVLIVDEPLDTILDDVARHLLGSYEAACPPGEALNKIDLDGSHECTPEFALDTELEAERSERASADEALISNIDAERTARMSADGALQASINTERTARMSADGALQDSINTETTNRVSADAALQTRINNEANARSVGDFHAGDVSGPHGALSINSGSVGSLEIQPAQVQRRVSGSCPAGQTMSAIKEDGSVTCVTPGATTTTRTSSLVNSAFCVREVPIVGTCLDYEYTAAQVVFCFAGEVATGGGYIVNKDRDFFVHENRPNQTSWSVRIWSDYPDLSGSAYVVCLKVGS